jgi:large subunit ribosomal protein L10
MAEGYEAKVRPEKTAAVDEIKQRFDGAPGAVLTEYRGLTVGEMVTLRSRLREAEVRYTVVKNTLARIAVDDAGLAELRDLFTGPTAVAYLYGDPVSGTKVLTTFAKDHPALVIKGGVVDGRVMSADETKALADVDPLDVSLAKIAGALESPLRAIVGILEAPLQRILFVLEQLASRPDSPLAAAGAEPAAEEEASSVEARQEVPAPAAEAPEAGGTPEASTEVGSEAAQEPAPEEGTKEGE